MNLTWKNIPQSVDFSSLRSKCNSIYFRYPFNTGSYDKGIESLKAILHYAFGLRFVIENARKTREKRNWLKFFVM